MRNKVQNITLGVLFLFLSCYFMQLMGFPNKITLLAGGAICLCMLIEQKSLKIDIGLCLLMVTMFSHFLILDGKSAVWKIVAYVPIVLYLLGNYGAGLAKSKKNNKEKVFLLLLFALILGYTIHGVLNSYLYFAGYRAESGARKWMDIWRQSFIPGTQHGIFYLPSFAMLLPAIVYFKKRKIMNVCMMIVSCFFFYTALVTRSRMSVLVLALVICGQLVLFVLLEKNELKKFLSNKRVLICGAILAAVMVIAAIVLMNTSVVKIFISNMGKDGGILNNVRFTAQRNVLKALPTHLMGGMDKSVIGYNYAHNVWMDMAKLTGIIPFAVFTLYTLFTLYEILRFLIKKNISTDVKMIAAGLYIVFFLYYSVEPAMEANMNYMTPWIFLNGMVHGYISKEKRTYENEC